MGVKNILCIGVCLVVLIVSEISLPSYIVGTTDSLNNNVDTITIDNNTMGLLDLFKKKNEQNNDSSAQLKISDNYLVELPKEEYSATEFMLNNKPFVGVFNIGIMKLNPKVAFGWYLSLIIEFKETIGSDMPIKKDSSKMQKFVEKLSKGVAGNKKRPNAIFLGRITGDGHTQAMWYVNNPETAHEYLQKLISSDKYPFDFNYEMTFDKEWKEAHYWLDPIIEH